MDAEYMSVYTFHGQRFSVVGWQSVRRPIEDCCADGQCLKRAWRRARCSGKGKGKVKIWHRHRAEAYEEAKG